MRVERRQGSWRKLVVGRYPAIIGPFSHGRSASITPDSVDPPASFARRYRLPIALGFSVLVAVIVVLRHSLNYFVEQPIVEPWKSYIEQLADASPLLALAVHERVRSPLQLSVPR